MTYTLNNKTFKTKETLKNYFSYILNTQPIGIPLSGMWEIEVLELLTHHSRYADKVGCGIKKIVVEYSDNIIAKYYPHFHIYRLDGTDEDFSYLKCLSYMKPNDKTTSRGANPKITDIKQAFRTEIRQFIYAFKQAQFKSKRYLKCPKLNVNTSIKSGHVDHIYPLTFDQLLYNFLEELNLSLLDIKIMDVDGIENMLLDRELADKWIKYHNTKAELRILHKTANLSHCRAKIDWEYKTK